MKTESSHRYHSGIFAALFGLLLIGGSQGRGEAPKEGPDWEIKICDESEPGTRMVISGVVYDQDGETPLPGVTVYVYHTDNRGHYTREGNDNRHPRLKGTMGTHTAGEYRFETIRPAPYPGGGIPAHVHYVVIPPEGAPQYFELLFEGDPAITERLRQRAAAGDFYHITALEKDDDGILRGYFDIHLKH